MNIRGNIKYNREERKLLKKKEVFAGDQAKSLLDATLTASIKVQAIRETGILFGLNMENLNKTQSVSLDVPYGDWHLSLGQQEKSLFIISCHTSEISRKVILEKSNSELLTKIFFEQLEPRRFTEAILKGVNEMSNSVRVNFEREIEIFSKEEPVQKIIRLARLWLANKEELIRVKTRAKEASIKLFESRTAGPFEISYGRQRVEEVAEELSTI